MEIKTTFYKCYTIVFKRKTQNGKNSVWADSYYNKQYIGGVACSLNTSPKKIIEWITS